MGTWGAGNFQNDGALDYLGEVIGHLAENVEELLGADLGTGERTLMPSVAMIATLCEHHNGVPPKLADVERWKQSYLATYDAEIDGYAPQGDFKAERRAAIAATFEALAKISREFASG